MVSLVLRFLLLLLCAGHWSAMSTGIFHFNRLQHELPGGKHQCFYFPMEDEFVLHIYVKVLRGGKLDVDVHLLNQTGHVLEKHLRTQEVSFSTSTSKGDYKLCISNLFSQLTSKRVSFVASWWEEHRIQAYREEVAELLGMHTNAMDNIGNMTVNIEQARMFITKSVDEMMQHFYSFLNLNRLVQRMSLAICLLVLTTSGVQVVFIRRFFRLPNPTSKQKNRI
ncbi:hypothetical protein CAPTEDRAFT_185458 [Capitella teleta]|uniref:GOLD domain-containing protein n=1 Tax=Capitella teleta TaxID=283909 RepID=R7VCY0_CAPTE|nr:hypothetical protein CAPTEDRAFT_185458 [Capitella teleta]|eukprot:ELU16499.1 hypothetical protein CAPTEDRAFT_185458 [Capitella teleta]